MNFMTMFRVGSTAIRIAQDPTVHFLFKGVRGGIQKLRNGKDKNKSVQNKAPQQAVPWDPYMLQRPESGRQRPQQQGRPGLTAKHDANIQRRNPRLNGYPNRLPHHHR